MEKIILEYLFTLDCEIIFVINKVVDDINSDNYFRYKENFKYNILKPYAQYSNKIHFIPVNLYLSYKNGKLNGKAFGLDNLFYSIHESFKNQKLIQKI